MVKNEFNANFICGLFANRSTEDFGYHYSIRPMHQKGYIGVKSPRLWRLRPMQYFVVTELGAKALIVPTCMKNIEPLKMSENVNYRNSVGCQIKLYLDLIIESHNIVQHDQTKAPLGFKKPLNPTMAVLFKF
jgi:hypothetical protein